MWRGAIAACLLPILLGLWMLIAHINAVNSKDDWFALPIILCFIFGTPIAAWLACRTIQKGKYPDFMSEWALACLAAFRGATIIHFWAALIHTTGNMIFSSNAAPVWVGVTEFVPNVLLVIVLQLLLWILITLPLSFICGTIYWGVTKDIRTHRMTIKIT